MTRTRYRPGWQGCHSGLCRRTLDYRNDCADDHQRRVTTGAVSANPFWSGPEDACQLVLLVDGLPATFSCRAQVLSVAGAQVLQKMYAD